MVTATDEEPGRIGILVIAENPFECAMLVGALRDQGWLIWVATNGPEAIDLFRRQKDRIGMILLNAALPGLDGVHTQRALRTIKPVLRKCFLNNGIYDADYLLAQGAIRVFNNTTPVQDVVAFLHMDEPYWK